MFDLTTVMTVGILGFAAGWLVASLFWFALEWWATRKRRPADTSDHASAPLKTGRQ